MRYLLVLILFSVKSTLVAQISDSLYNYLPPDHKPKNKLHLTLEEKINILHDVKYSQCIGNKNELTRIYNDLNKLLPSNKNYDEVIIISAALGCYAAKIEDSSFNQEAKKHYKSVLSLTQKDTSHYFEILEAYVKMSDIYLYENKIDSSLELLSGYKQFIKNDDTSSLLNLYFTYERIYTLLGQHQLAIEFEHAGINLYYKNCPNKDEYLMSLVSIARSYILLYGIENKQIFKDSALYYLNTVLSFNYSNSKLWVPICSFYRGKLFFHEGLYSEAIQQFDKFDASRVEGDDNYYFGSEQYNNIYRLLSRVRLGDKTAYVALEKAPINLGMMELHVLINRELYLHWQQKQDWQKAFHYLLLYKKNADSLDLLNSRNKFFELNQKYKVAEKEAAISTLEILNLKQHKTIYQVTFLSVGLVLLITLLFVLRQLKEKRKKTILALEKITLLHRLNSIEIAQVEEKVKNQKEKELIAQRQREEISKNMHDEISNGIAALRYYIADLKISTEDHHAKKLLTAIEEETSAMYSHTRAFMNNLRGINPVQPYDLFSFLENLQSKFITETSINIEIDADKNEINLQLDLQQKEALYYVIKEAVVNCIKHAAATSIHIIIKLSENNCSFNIIDNGIGFFEHTSDTGMGLQNMQYRMAAVSGTVEISSSSQGTTVNGEFRFNNSPVDFH